MKQREPVCVVASLIIYGEGAVQGSIGKLCLDPHGFRLGCFTGYLAVQQAVMCMRVADGGHAEFGARRGRSGGADDIQDVSQSLLGAENCGEGQVGHCAGKRRIGTGGIDFAVVYLDVAVVECVAATGQGQAYCSNGGRQQQGLDF